MKLGRWLRIGLHVKRWIVLVVAGVTLLSLALAMALAWFYRNYAFPQPTTAIVTTGTLQFIDHPWRELLIGTVGLVMALAGFYQLGHSLLSPFFPPSEGRPRLVDALERHRFGQHAPRLRVVAVGGGTGLSTLLRGLKRHEGVAITAIVSIADDGGSSGRLREEFDMPPPGDVRNCIVALADVEPLLGRLFQYRFEQPGSPLLGHSFGNLFLAAMTEMTGSFQEAVAEVSRVLAVRGEVLPATMEKVTLCAEMRDGRQVCGESNITAAPAAVARLYLQHRAEPNPEAIRALLEADVIVLGPGSLYTSVLPNLLVDGIAQAIRFSSGTVLYVCNVATQPGETDHFGAADHVRVLQEHVGGDLFDLVLVNDDFTQSGKIKPEWGVESVSLAGLQELQGSFHVVHRDLVDIATPLRHDPDKLADAILECAASRVPDAWGERSLEAQAAAAV